MPLATTTTVIEQRHAGYPQAAGLLAALSSGPAPWPQPAITPGTRVLSWFKFLRHFAPLSHPSRWHSIQFQTTGPDLAIVETIGVRAPEHVWSLVEGAGPCDRVLRHGFWTVGADAYLITRFARRPDDTFAITAPSGRGRRSVRPWPHDRAVTRGVHAPA